MGYTEKFLNLVEQEYPKAEAHEKIYKGLQELGQLERILNLYRIEDKKTGEYRFYGDCINPEQKWFLDNQTGRDLILKPRQIGMTALQIILSLDEALFVPGTRAGIMAHTKEKALTSIFERVRKTWEWFQKDWGEYIPIKCDTDNANSLTFSELGTSIIVAYDFRSVKLNRLHVSETAFIPQDERITASQQAVPFPPYGKISHETTPRGRAGWFFDNWTSSKSETSVWKQHFFKWWEHYPEDGQRFDVSKVDYDDREKELVQVYGVGLQAILWRRWKIQESYKGDPEKFEVDYPTDERDCFIGGYGLLSRSLLVKVEKGLKEPIFRGEIIEENGMMKAVPVKDGPITIWEMPKAGIEYCGGLDSAEGRGKNHDYCAGIVKNRTTKRQVAQLHSNKIPPDELARYAYRLGTFYNKAWWCPERNSCGGETVRLLDQMNYGMIYSPKADNVERLHDDQRLGFYTSGSSKEHIVLQFSTRIRGGMIIPSSQEWFGEMTNFGRDDQGRFNALAGHDDLFMAGCLCEEMDKTLGDLEIDFSEEHQSEPMDLSTGF